MLNILHGVASHWIFC